MLIECPYCIGFGWDPKPKDVCPVCSGVGKIEVPETHLKCAFCDGSGASSKAGGIFSNRVKIPCPVCSGTGVVLPTKYG